MIAITLMALFIITLVSIAIMKWFNEYKKNDDYVKNEDYIIDDFYTLH